MGRRLFFKKNKRTLGGHHLLIPFDVLFRKMKLILKRRIWGISTVQFYLEIPKIEGGLPYYIYMQVHMLIKFVLKMPHFTWNWIISVTASSADFQNKKSWSNVPSSSSELQSQNWTELYYKVAFLMITGKLLNHKIFIIR